MSTQLGFSTEFLFLWGDTYVLQALSLCLSLWHTLRASVCTQSSVTLWCAAARFHSPAWWHRSDLQVHHSKTDEGIQGFITFVRKGSSVAALNNWPRWCKSFKKMHHLVGRPQKRACATVPEENSFTDWKWPWESAKTWAQNKVGVLISIFNGYTSSCH